MFVKDVGPPDCGGDQYLASLWKIYNDLLATEPAVLQQLMKGDWPFRKAAP